MNSNSPLNAGRGVLLALALGMCAGCGRGDDLPRAAVHGKVTLDGQPLAAGAITFTPTSKEGGPVVGARIENGEYELSTAEGPGAGTLKVAITADQQLSFELDDPRQFASHAAEIPPGNPVPARYNTQTELERTAEAGAEHEWNFDLVATPVP